MSKSAYGPENPHPLSQMKTELVWEGKYDEYGRKREVALPTFPLVMQKIETIDEPRDRSKAQGSLFDDGTAHVDAFRNVLVWGDNKLTLAALLRDYRGKVKLCVIDPPFDVGADFTMDIEIGESASSFEKEQSLLEAVAYRDMWGRETNSYLHMMYERLVLMRELLSEDGSIVVHCDWHMSHYLKQLLSEVMGEHNFTNEIVWWYYNKFQGNVNRFPANHDVLLWFTKSSSYTFNAQTEEREKAVKQLKRVWDKEKGAIVNAKDANGNVIYQESTAKRVDDVWRISMLQPADKSQNLGYATQKPEALLERVIDALTNEGDLVADFFCGSGTALAVAEKMGRRWIGGDLGRYAIHTTRKRLIGAQRDLNAQGKRYRPFDVYNLGRYERQWWQQARLHGANDEHRATVLKFFRSQPLTSSPSPLLHGSKAGAYVHVDDIDSILTFEELAEVARAAKSAGGRSLICLAWEFQMDLRTKAQALEAELGLDIRLTYIPREIMEPNRNEVQFFDAAALDAEAVVSTEGGCKKVDVKLNSFIPSLTEVPEKELQALKERVIKSPFDFIDFWAVDFEHRDDKPFEHHWQDYRTRKDRSLLIQSNCGWEYDSPGVKRIRIKVIDVFGIDTTKVIEVTV